MNRLCLCVLLAACGGAAATTSGAAKPAAGPQTVSPETYAEVAAFFQKRGPIVRTCYNNAITNRKLSEKSEGRVSLAMQINAAGRPQGVRVAESTLHSKDVEDCLVDLISKWDVPAPGADMDFAFSYEFRQD
ncbi:MAG TPA: AgmX/PglI C-terminal domain-containing protein [Haliangiales bacterium]|nr:AgmX/PglI C-terminal domain-containing protein [Haliangiales bacterium]